jgi:hypothetical protein
MTVESYLIKIAGVAGETIFSLAPDGTIACEPENYELALREICQIFVRASA